MKVHVSVKPLPPILNVQMDNAISDNKNRFVFIFWSLISAKRVFFKVYVNFMLAKPCSIVQRGHVCYGPVVFLVLWRLARCNTYWMSL